MAKYQVRSLYLAHCHDAPHNSIVNTPTLKVTGLNLLNRSPSTLFESGVPQPPGYYAQNDDGNMARVSNPLCSIWLRNRSTAQANLFLSDSDAVAQLPLKLTQITSVHSARIDRPVLLQCLVASLTAPATGTLHCRFNPQMAHGGVMAAALLNYDGYEFPTAIGQRKGRSMALFNHFSARFTTTLTQQQMRDAHSYQIGEVNDS